MKLSLILSLTLVVGCGFSASKVSSAVQPAQQLELPEFVDDAPFEGNMNPGAPRQERVYARNYEAITKLLKSDPTVVRQEMKKRLTSNQPIELRLLAGAVLVLEKDDEGRQFFLTQAKIPRNLGDLYVTFNHLVWSTESLTGSNADLSWAEDMMIEALKNRTQVKAREALDVPFEWSEPYVEIRALAIDYGHFADHLAEMHSERALPVIISLLQEHTHYNLKSCIAYLGSYNDDRAKSLLITILTAHNEGEHGDTYESAVWAASKMGLKAAVPILLRHLDDKASYHGLRALAGVDAIPAIEAALPKLKSYARAEAELTIIHLRGGDQLPSLLELVKRKDYLKRDDVMMRLEELRDSRSVPTMSAALCNDTDWFVRLWSIRVLAAIKNKEAMRGLVQGLGCDYSKLNRWKTNRDYDYNREYREEINKALKEITGEDFGVDRNRWSRWLDAQKLE